jgi:hypothetical protein
MATVSKRRLSTSTTKNLSEKTKNNTTTTTTTGKTINPFQKRLNDIRIHILNNRKQRKLTHGEPTLIFDRFLYLGGFKSLKDKVSFILFLFLFYFFFK